MLFTRDIYKLKDTKIIKVNNKRKDVSGKYKPKKIVLKNEYAKSRRFMNMVNLRNAETI